MIKVFWFIAFLGITNALIYKKLSSFTGDNVVNTVYNGSTNIFVTATLDNVEMLKMILFTNGATSMSAYDLTQNRYSANSDFLKPWSVTGLTTFKTRLSKTDMLNLHGSVYITTESQAKNANFLVCDITKTQNLEIDKAAGIFTVVFLNSQLTNYPFSATAFSSWIQPSNTTAFIYSGLPLDQEEVNNTQIFSNPVNTGHRMLQMPSVEDFSVTLETFYIRVGGAGGLSVVTSPTYKDINQSTAKSKTTTGFYMKSYSEQTNTKNINLLRDTIFTGVTGANSIAFILTNGVIDIQTFDSITSKGGSFGPSKSIASWITPMIGRQLTISSTNTEGGQFFIQYYVIQSKDNDGGTTQSVETSTKSVGSARIEITMGISFIMYLIKASI